MCRPESRAKNTAREMQARPTEDLRRATTQATDGKTLRLVL